MHSDVARDCVEFSKHMATASYVSSEMNGLNEEAKKKNITVIVISHRPSILSVVDKILVLQDGSIAAYGSKQEVETRIKMLSGGIIHID